MEKPLLATEFLDRARRYFGGREAVLTVDGGRVKRFAAAPGEG